MEDSGDEFNDDQSECSMDEESEDNNYQLLEEEKADCSMVNNDRMNVEYGYPPLSPSVCLSRMQNGILEMLDPHLCFLIQKCWTGLALTV